VFDAGIKALVELAAEEPPSQPPRELIYCRFPLLDGTGNERQLLDLAISSVANLLERKVPTLVACGRGLSRSPAVAAAALALIYQEPPGECLKRVAQHCHSDVSPGLWSEIASYLDSTRSL
jgi:hypothetical protein